MKHVVFLSLGSNLGDKNANLEEAILQIQERVGNVIKRSSIIETEPWGFISPNSFLNMVIQLETDYIPIDILMITQEIEKSIGRSEKTQASYQDRLIDIDIILYDDLILKTEKLQLPHPLFHQRDFVLKPLCEIAPEYIHPVLKKKIKEF